jgi:hypothetical protein
MFLNHSCNTNIMDAGNGLDVVVRDIKKGEEATYDYGVFEPREEKAESFECRCGEPNCRVTIKDGDVTDEIRRRWAAKVREAVILAPHVDQPLREGLKYARDPEQKAMLEKLFSMERLPGFTGGGVRGIPSFSRDEPERVRPIPLYARTRIAYV